MSQTKLDNGFLIISTGGIADFIMLDLVLVVDSNLTGCFQTFFAETLVKTLNNMLVTFAKLNVSLISYYPKSTAILICCKTDKGA